MERKSTGVFPVGGGCKKCVSTEMEGKRVLKGFLKRGNKIPRQRK